MTPTKGRIVIYKNTEEVEMPAVVRGVTEAGVDLSVFGSHAVFSVDNVPEGDGPNTWAWPPRTDTVTEVEV